MFLKRKKLLQPKLEQLNFYAKNRLIKSAVLLFRSLATGADILIRYSAEFIYFFHLMNVGLPRPSRFYITVAHFVAADLRLSANTAYSAHM